MTGTENLEKRFLSMNDHLIANKCVQTILSDKNDSRIILFGAAHTYIAYGEKENSKLRSNLFRANKC